MIEIKSEKATYYARPDKITCVGVCRQPPAVAVYLENIQEKITMRFPSVEEAEGYAEKIRAAAEGKEAAREEREDVREELARVRERVTATEENAKTWKVLNDEFGYAFRARKEWEDDKEEQLRKMEERIRATQEIVAGWKKQQDEEDRKHVKEEKTAKTAEKAKGKEAKPFVPPTDDELIRHILENGFDKTARQKPEGIVRRFKRYYNRDGKTWRLASGKPMRDWKKAMATWINNIDEDAEEQEKAQSGANSGKEGETWRPETRNAFNNFEQNAYGFDELEKELTGGD